MAATHTSGSALGNYLVLYNTLSALLRGLIIARTVHLWGALGTPAVWGELHVLARWAETITAVEVIHAAAGLVRAAPATAALQVAGRNTIVWAITRNYPDVAAREWAYPCMLIVWNAADILRYTYYVVDGGSGQAPRFLSWLRYNMFIVLYPVGILSEMWLVHQVIQPSKARSSTYQYLLWLGLLIYVPAFYILYGHMLSQRSKAGRKPAKPKGL
ncbi:PTPLA-domain-containing protein [Parathielavia appendiculata]|uniref:Very-long-chain (3R)-3-hydroxyacyl-CoA dehydratase n=1 Tax=Parathielavia appendiculata TaxID=2587402 RepID=A0AAN6YZ59_9PEZI|nr:PTPLA-domain-containing protein [Parathielavia appendiculata]